MSTLRLGFDLRKARNLIDGQLVGAIDGDRYDSIDPADGSILGSVPRGKTADIDRAAAAAAACREDAPRGFLERFIRGEIYKIRPDLTAIVHSHSPSVIPFSLVRRIGPRHQGRELRMVTPIPGFVGIHKSARM